MPDRVPWLAVTAAEYEALMGPEGLDLLAPLSAAFAQVYRAARPRRVLVLGCGTGAGLEHVHPGVTDRVVGIDLNLQFLAVARQRHHELGARLELFCADARTADLPEGGFDLVHAALLAEYLDPEALAAVMARAAAPAGTCAVVQRLPGGEPAEEAWPVESVRALAEVTRAVEPADLAAHLGRRGLRRAGAWELATRGGRRLRAAIFRR
jgi:SAM-dependent methyltransferase